MHYWRGVGTADRGAGRISHLVPLDNMPYPVRSQKESLHLYTKRDVGLSSDKKLKDSKPTNPGVFTIYHSGKQWDLSDNSLTAPVPKFLANLQLLSVLIDEEISPICKSDSCKSSSKKNNSKVIPVVASVASVVVLVLVVALAILWKIKRNDLSSSDQKTDVVDSRKTNQLQGSLKNRQFTHAQLKRMTNNFGRVVGKGGFGTVYHGYLDETQVAVKMLSLSPVQGYKQFQAEVELLLRVHHRNLTTIVGYCDYGSNMGLIYEFMDKGNLAEYLKDSSRGVLNWKGRFGISLEAAHKDSFGVVLLEIITNRPVTTKTYNQTTHISQWVSLMLTNGDMEAIADSRMQGDFEIASMKREVEVAMACVSPTSTKRPTMNDVVTELNRCLSAEIDRNYSIC
ncbi:hypothetical protein Godav_008574 [Gossypium davidsonii]|uniref:Protein kinase domain-containing protein n=1 Tax=Gossypium davidsonii TaxID=34287 RepID=A0A7J8SAG5_GOSDV|nr:hypothetical protein [Gossypium davidsonii]